MSKHFGCVRFVYNHMLALKVNAWENNKISLSRFQLSSLLPQLKEAEETCWLKEVNSQSLQVALADLESAYSKFSRDKTGFPRFKNKHGKQSFQAIQNIKVLDRAIKLPKLGKIKTIIDTPLVGIVKNITVSRTTTGKYFASVLCEIDEPIPEKLPITEAGTIGIDLGIKHFATLSTGEKIENQRPLKKRLKRLQRAQRKLSKRTRGSKNRDKQRKRVALIHEKISNTRKDFLHKLTTRLVNDNQVDSFAIEDLAVKNMMQNRKLARSIADVGWGEFRRQLEYKAERKGKNILVIGRFEPSSKMGPCGHIKEDLKLSDRIWTCHCGVTCDRDINAARNIKRFALHPQNFVGRDAPELTLEEIGC